MRRTKIEIRKRHILAIFVSITFTFAGTARGEETSNGEVNDDRRGTPGRTIVAPSVALQIVNDPTPEEIQTLIKAQKEDLEILIRRTHDFRDVVDGMVRRAYEMRRRYIVDLYQDRIRDEEDLATKARKNAIAYFEEFLRKYPNTQPYTPDAMYRLAELYYDDSYYNYLEDFTRYGDAQDRGEADDLALPQKEFNRTIKTFQNLISRYPDYRNIDGAYYILGYCLNDTGREEEARLTWLNLVCANKYKYSPEAAGDVAEAKTSAKKKRPAATLDTGIDGEATAVFVDPFANCEPIAKNSRFFFESWWLVGNYHFDYDTSRFGVETAISAYKKLVIDQKHKFYDKGLYKLAWSYFKANMYPEAIASFSKVVDFADTQPAAKGTGMRPEAVQYLAVCFFSEDWDENLIPDEVSGIERLQDPSLMPQDRPWTREVYRQLGEIYYDNEKNEEAIIIWKLFLKKWPLDVQAPFVQEKIAFTYNKMRLFNEEIVERSKLDAYGSGSKWWEANADDPAAQNEVAGMVRDAMLEAAYFHHRTAQKLRQRGLAAQDAELLERSLEEYNMAASAYRSFIEQNPDTPDAYDISFSLAETLFWSGQHMAAKEEYSKVRDSNLDDKYRDDAAYMVILCLEEILKKQIDDGTLVLREEPPEAQGDPLAVNSLAVEPLLIELMRERDEFIKGAPKHERAATFKYQTAQTYYRHGHWDEAKVRYEKIYNEYCTSNPVGVISWKTLLNMATTLNDLDEKERLALLQKKKKCRFAEDGAEEIGDDIPLDDVLGDVAMQRSLDKFKECMSSKNATTCTEAGAALVGAVNQAPKHPSADAAMHNAALAYETAQRFETAMQLYGRIVEQYPKSQWVDKCLFRQANSASAFFEYEKALDNYRILADESRFKDSDYRVDAINNSAYILTNLQSYIEAVPYWERLSRESEEPKKRAEAAYITADMYFRAKKWRRAVEAYNKFLKKFGRDKESGSLVVKASYRTGVAYRTMRAHKGEVESWSRTIDYYKRLVNESGSMSAEYAAESQFLLIEEDMRKFEKFSIKGSQKTIGLKIREGAERVKDFETRYRKVQEYRRPEWSLAAEFRIGYAYEVYAKALLNIPPPPLDKEAKKLLRQLPPEDREMVLLEVEDKFRADMENYVMGAEEKAKAEYKLAVELAGKGNISNEWTLLAIERMNAYDPDNFPRQHNGIFKMEESTLAAPPWAPEVQ